MTTQMNPIDQLTSHYEKVLATVVSNTKQKAFMLTAGDIDAMEKDCLAWIAALRGIYKVKETIFSVVGVVPDEPYEDQPQEITTDYDKELL